MTVHHIHTQAATATFDDFWQAYPRKIGKPLARAKWEAITGPGLETRTLDRDSNTYVEITLTATPDEILEGAKRYTKSKMDPNTYKIDTKYVCHPATWLNQGRWEDE